MTEKRFTKYVPNSCYTSIISIVDHETNKRSGSIDDFVDMMNALHEENKELKQRNEFLKKQLDRVCSENEIMGDKLKKIERTL